jgi:hypothetical protein
LHLIRRLARTPPTEQCTTAITLGELVYGVRKRGSAQLAERVQELIASAEPILPFDESAARRYGELRAELERTRQRVAEPDLRIAAIALAATPRSSPATSGTSPASPTSASRTGSSTNRPEPRARDLPRSRPARTRCAS